MSVPAPVVELPQRRSLPRAVFVALRPRQWTKNLLLFAGIIFAAKLGDLTRWAEAVAAFAAYCAASSASYLVNDVRDAPHDRLHPVKRARPAVPAPCRGSRRAPGRLRVRARRTARGAFDPLPLHVLRVAGRVHAVAEACCPARRDRS